MRATTILGIAFVATGCASGPPAVLDADYGRLKPEQTAAVDSARTDLAKASEELATARSKIADARLEQDRAQADLAAAKQETERVKRLMEAAEVRSQAAEAHGEYAEALTEARQAAEATAQARVELAAAKVELMKLQALEQAQLQPSRPYDQKAFHSQVVDAQKKLEAAQANLRKLEDTSTTAQRRWEDLAKSAQK